MTDDNDRNILHEYSVTENSRQSDERETENLIISPKTHCFPQVPEYYSDKSENQMDRQENVFLNQDEDFKSPDQPTYDILIRARIEIETWLTTQDLIKKNIISCRKKTKAPENRIGIFPKLNIRSIICRFARSCFSHHIMLLKSAIEKRKNIMRLLDYFQPFEINGMIAQINCLNIDLRKIVDECMEKDPKLVVSSDEILSSCPGSTSTEKINTAEIVLETFLYALKMTRFVKITVDFMELHFVSSRRIETMNELKKMLNAQKSITHGKLNINLEHIRSEQVLDQNHSELSTKTTELRDNLEKEHRSEQKFTVENEKLSKLICNFCYFSCITNSFKKNEFYQIIATIRAKQFLGNKKFTCFTIADQPRAKLIRWLEPSITFAYVCDDALLNINVRGDEMEILWKFNKIEIIETHSGISL